MLLITFNNKISQENDRFAKVSFCYINNELKTINTAPHTAIKLSNLLSEWTECMDRCLQHKNAQSIRLVLLCLVCVWPHKILLRLVKPFESNPSRVRTSKRIRVSVNYIIVTSTLKFIPVLPKLRVQNKCSLGLVLIGKYIVATLIYI